MISDYSARLLDELKRRYRIDLYHDSGYVPHIGLRSADFGCYDYRLFERNAKILGYHALVYQMGNSPYHGYMYETLLRHPGIVTLHDLGLADFHFWYAQQAGVDGNAHIRREFEAFFGAGPTRSCVTLAAEHTGGLAAGLHPAGVPPQRPDLRAGDRRDRALALVRRAGPKPVPRPSRQDVGGPVRGHHPGSFPGAAQGHPRPLRDSAGGPDHRQPRTAPCHEDESETIAAFAPLAHAIPEALLIFVGNEIDNGEARRKVMELGLQHRVRFLGHYPDDLADLAAIADIGVCLRRPPTNGETSAALMDLLRLGVPTIVSDVGSFSCYPDSVVRKHRWSSDGLIGLTHALRELAEDRPRREALGRAAWRYVHQNHGWPSTADSYEEIIERTAAGRTRPQADGPRSRTRRSSPRRNGSRPHRETPCPHAGRAAATLGQVPIPNLAR